MKRLTPLLFIFLLQNCGYGQYPHMCINPLNGKIVLCDSSKVKK